MRTSVNLVDLVKSFHTSIYLQKSASRQPRTSLSDFGGDFIRFFIRFPGGLIESPAAGAHEVLRGPRRSLPGALDVLVSVGQIRVNHLGVRVICVNSFTRKREFAF